MTPQFVAQNRRRFLKFLAASPLAALQASGWQNQLIPFEMKDAKDAFSVADFEEMARRLLPPAHWGYMASGSDDDATLKMNVEAYKRIGLKPRRLVDVSKVDPAAVSRKAQDVNQRTPYTQQWNFGVQQEVGGDVMFEVAYT